MSKPKKHRSKNGAPLAWLIEHVGHEGLDCLTWPFAKQNGGRGTVYTNGSDKLAAREMCRLARGEPPTPRHEAAHSCGNGHLGCVNPKHLRWATHKENMQDAVAHGTLKGERKANSKVTAEQVKVIRSLYGTMKSRDIAAMFGLSEQGVCNIVKRRAWAWL